MIERKELNMLVRKNYAKNIIETLAERKMHFEYPSLLCKQLLFFKISFWSDQSVQNIIFRVTPFHKVVTSFLGISLVPELFFSFTTSPCLGILKNSRHTNHTINTQFLLYVNYFLNF